MTFPNIPEVDTSNNIDLEDSINLFLTSMALVQLGIAHLINAEAEKIQHVLEMLQDQTSPEIQPTIDDLLKINRSVDQILRNVIKNEMLLQFKLEETLTISTTTTSTTTTTTSSTTTSTTSTTTTSTTTTTTTTTKEPVDLGSAWSQGIHFGHSSIAKYTTLESNENDKTVDLLLGETEIDVGTVQIHRSGNSLLVTITTDSPYVMSQAHLYVDNTPPTNSAPGQLGHTYDPGFFFTSHTFTVDISDFAGEKLYIAAHAHIFQ
ncbi:MAG: hypothetical protein WAO23_05160 [Dethiobacteria bacterium]